MKKRKEHRMYDASDIYNLIQESTSSPKKECNLTKTFSCMFFLQEASLKWNGHPLFSENIYICDSGPYVHIHDDHDYNPKIFSDEDKDWIVGLARGCYLYKDIELINLIKTRSYYEYVRKTYPHIVTIDIMVNSLNGENDGSDDNI